MRRIKQPMFRYGEADFDRDYRRWGLHDPAVQIEEAKSVLQLFPADRPFKILDLACGIGTHAIHWARQGHDVTGVDISATFIEEARKASGREHLPASFIVEDIRRLAYRGSFDVVTWIERSFFDQDIANTIHGYLVEGGVFIMDVRNPDHPRTRACNADFRTWREQNGRFYLESHETDESGLRHNVWIEIDPDGGKIIERSETFPAMTFAETLETLKRAGLNDIGLRTMDGQRFSGGEEPYWLWVVAKK